ncbi:TPA: sigma-70 family RNA polymerase sigma factor [Candidatus Woesearchaeota archaeon]|nr:sigma-70 family RNA polymerase sigma factor [Candidatus Woesearchaeota archaeon]
MDSVQAYLESIGNLPSLTIEDEKQIGISMRDGYKGFIRKIVRYAENQQHDLEQACESELAESPEAVLDNSIDLLINYTSTSIAHTGLQFLDKIVRKGLEDQARYNTTKAAYLNAPGNQQKVNQLVSFYETHIYPATVFLKVQEYIKSKEKDDPSLATDLASCLLEPSMKPLIQTFLAIQKTKTKWKGLGLLQKVVKTHGDAAQRAEFIAAKRAYQVTVHEEGDVASAKERLIASCTPFTAYADDLVRARQDHFEKMGVLEEVIEREINQEDAAKGETSYRGISLLREEIALGDDRQFVDLIEQCTKAYIDGQDASLQEDAIVDFLLPEQGENRVARLSLWNVVDAIELDPLNATYFSKEKRAIIRGEQELSQRVLKWGVSIAKEYMNIGVPFTDLIGAANVGIMKAARRYEPRSGFRFTTYSSKPIRTEIWKEITCSKREIKISSARLKKAKEARVAAWDLQGQLARPPTDEEVANHLGITLTDYYGRITLPIEISASKKIGEGDDSRTILDLLADTGKTSEDHYDIAELQVTMSGALGELTKREEEVLRMRFGIGDYQAHQLAEIGNKFGLTRERIRQIEAKALQKLRHPAKAKRLQPFHQN